MRNALPLLLLALPSSAMAQFSMPWSSIDSGGGFASGGNYSLFSVIGQPDAAVMSGGGNELSGGFVAGLAGSASGCSAADVGAEGGVPSGD